MKKVSVIVPVYNVEQYLERCLTSLVNQTLEEIEILVINDGSKDNSQEIITQFQEKYPEKIRGFQKENGGLSDARNYGLDRVNGEFIGFVDSDDYVSNTMFEEMYALAQKHNAEMVVCNIQKVNERGTVTQKLTQIPNMPEKIILDENFSVFSDLSYFACNKLFRRNLFENKRFKKGIHFEDIQLIPQLLLECNILAQTQKYHYNYFERADSITKTHTERGLDILRAVETVEESLLKSKYYNRRKELENFCILEGVYSFLAYLAYVKDDNVYQKLSDEYRSFIKKRDISTLKILKYRRFSQNYLLSLSLRKKIYYLLYFFNQQWLLKKLIAL